MISHLKRSLQTSVEKHFAAPPVRKRPPKQYVPSPLITCPEMIIFPEVPRGERPRKVIQPLFQFRPKEHQIWEALRIEDRASKKSMFDEDAEEINLLLPIDILLRSIQEQADRINKSPEPMPLKKKLSPQFRRIKIKRNRKSRSKRMKTPERGRLFQPVIKRLTVEQFVALSPQPKLITLKMFTALLGIHNGILPAHQINAQFIAQQRSVLYQEEGAKWIKIFLPGIPDDDPTIPSVFRIFDNTDEGVPEKYYNLKDEYATSPASLYQFRVITKRFLLVPETDEQEVFFLTEILGMSREEIHFTVLQLILEEAKFRKAEQNFQDMVFNFFKETFNANLPEEEKQIEDKENTFEANMMPILNSLLQPSHAL